MTVTLYSNPDLATYGTLRWSVTVNGVAADLWATSRTTEFGVTDYWALGETVEQAWLTIATDETVTVAVTFLAGTVSTVRIYPSQTFPSTAYTISGNTITFSLAPNTGKAWVEVNGETAEPLHIRSVGLQATPTGTTFDGSQTQCGAGQTLIFDDGVWNIGKQFKVLAGGTVFLKGGAWVRGSFDIVDQDDVTIAGHGVLSGDQWNPATVQALPTYAERLSYSLVYGFSATYAHTGNVLYGPVLTRGPWSAQFEGINQAIDVMILNPWFSNGTGLTLEGDASTGNTTLHQNCYIWSCDDSLDLGEYIGAHTVEDCLLASSASATFIIGYWPGEDYGLVSTITDCVVVPVQSHNASPESGIIFHAWSDGEATEEDHVIADYTIDNVYIERDTCRAQLFNLSNTAYPWGAAAAQRGTIKHWVIRNVTCQGTPTTLSKISGFNADNTPVDILFTNLRIGGEIVSTRNYTTYFTLNQYPRDIAFGGRYVTTAIDVCNMALGLIGNKAKVTAISPSDGSAEADHCARLYPIAVRSMLELHNWSFAKRKRELTVVNADPDDTDDPAWYYRYQLPDDWVKVIAILPLDTTNDYLVAGVKQPVDYEIKYSEDDEQQRIYTNEEDAWLRYIYYEDDPNQWSQLFIQAVAWHLASLLAGPIIKGSEGHAEAQRCQQRMSAYLAEARMKDANERQATVERKASWLRGR